MKLLYIGHLAAEYPGYLPDFGILKHLIYQYTENDISRAHAAWDGFWFVAIPFLLVLFIKFCKKLLVKIKRQKVIKLINGFAENDPFWNSKAMHTMSKDLFYEVQYAWFNNDFKDLAPMLSDKLKFEWQETWKIMKINNYKFVVGKIDVKNVNIISVEDHFDNNKDKFNVEVSGYIKRYVKNKPDDSLLARSASDIDGFIDIYSFIRQDDQWLLDEIHHGAKFVDIFRFENKDYNQLN